MFPTCVAVGGDHVRVGQGVQYQRDNVDSVPFERSVSVQGVPGQHLHEGTPCAPLPRDALEGLECGEASVIVAARELRVPLSTVEASGVRSQKCEASATN